MKKTDLLDLKKLDIEVLRQKVSQERNELSNLIMDKKMSKLKDIKTVSKKRKTIAQLMTILRQKEIIKELENANR